MKSQTPPLRIIAETAVVAVLYYALARFGFLLALPPGNVTVLWPPSGLALAALMTFGYRSAGGVWLGSFLVNLSVLSPDAALPVAAAIATGSALQAVFGAWLIARAIPNFSPRYAERENLSTLPVAPLDIARFAGLAALSCVIAASVGVASLCAATFAPWSKAAGLWLAWWIGDYAGILVFTPALIVVTALIRRRPFAEPIIFPFAAGCLGLALIAAAIIGQMRLDRNEEALVDATEDMVGQIRGAIDNSLVNLVALEGLFAASDEVSREEFKKFTLRLLRVDPTTFALSWRPRIRAAEEAKYVEAAHKDGLADFAILEQDPSGKRSPAAPRPEYFPIYFSESLGAQSDLFGLDVSADPVRLASFNRARDSGEMVATPPTRRVGQQTQQKNIVLQKAVYRYGVIPDSIQGRRDNLVGYVQSVLRMDALVKTLLGGPAYQEREMFLFDVSSVEHPELIVVHPTPPETPGSPPPLADLAELRRGVHYEAPLSVGGRPWLALVRPLTSPAHVLWNWRIWMVLLMGLALSAALLVYLRARQRSDASLREAEEHYRGLFDSAPAMYVTARVEDGLPIVTDCNALFLRALGYAREEVIGRLLTEFHSGPSRKELIEAYETALRGQAIEGERELLTRTGALIPVMMRGDPIFDAERAVIGTRKMYVDISERKHAEDEFRLVVESAPNGMLMLDENGVIALVNTQMEILFGYRREDLLGQSIEILVPQRFRASHPGQREQFFNDPKARMMGHGRELFGLKSDGTEFPVEVGLNPITSSHGLQVLASVIDISERKRSEDALRQSEATTAMLIDSAPDAMLALDELGQIVRVNRQTEEMFGYAREELLGKRIKELLGPRILDLFQERKDAAANAPGSRFSAAVEVAGRHKDGGEFATDVTLNPLDMGGWRLFMVTVRDIRHRKAAEVSIRQLTDTLEERVAARTADLKREVSERETVEKALKETNAQFQLSVAALEKRNQEVTLLSAMIQMVECCQDADEAYQVMARHLRRLFPLHPGAIYMISASRNLIECAARWGDDANAAPALTFTPKDCWALRRGRIYKVESPLAEMLCEHVEVGNELPGPYICAPLIAHSEALGILHLKYAATNGAAEPPDSALLQTVAEQLSLVVGNLRLRETLSQQNIRDPLTGLFNRRYMEESLQRDLQRAKRSGNSLTIAMVDVDHFKRFNDSLGHAAGDVVLREVAQLMKSKMRGSDVVCRYGGEEFAIISPEMTLEVARQKMDYLREELKKLSIRYQEQRLDTPTISIGLSAFPIHGADGEALLKSADEALYRAKKAGRDRVVVADRPADVNATEASVH